MRPLVIKLHYNFKYYYYSLHFFLFRFLVWPYLCSPSVLNVKKYLNMTEANNKKKKKKKERKRECMCQGEAIKKKENKTKS
jgi:hypothetical protein